MQAGGLLRNSMVRNRLECRLLSRLTRRRPFRLPTTQASWILRGAIITSNMIFKRRRFGLRTCDDFALKVAFSTMDSGHFSVWRRKSGQTKFPQALNLQNVATLQTMSSITNANSPTPASRRGYPHHWNHGRPLSVGHCKSCKSNERRLGDRTVPSPDVSSSGAGYLRDRK